MTDPTLILIPGRPPADRVTLVALQAHINDPTPHPALDARIDAIETQLGTADPLGQYVLESTLGANSGTAQLGSDGILKFSQRPPISAHFSPANQAARLALSTAIVGDFAHQADNSTTYQLTALPASVNGNWIVFSASGAVDSVDGLTGTIVLPSDAIAATGSKRTLGSGAQQAAAGNHNHSGVYQPIGLGGGGDGPNGLWFTGHSYVDAASGWLLDRIWPQILRRMYGFDDNKYHFPVQGAAADNADAYTGLDTTDWHGEIRDVNYTPIGGVTGGGPPTRTIRLQLGGVNTGPSGFPTDSFRLSLTGGNDLTSGVPKSIPRQEIPGINLFYPDAMLMWASIHVGTAGRADGGGGAVTVHLNGGDYSMFAVSGSIALCTDPWGGGIGQLDAFLTHSALRGALNATKTTLRADANGKVDASIARRGLMIHTSGYNDIHSYTEQNAWKSAVRHMLIASRWMMRYTCNDCSAAGAASPTITENPGVGGGSFGSLTTSPWWQYLGQRRYYGGGAGSTPGYWQYAIPSDFNGEPLDFMFTAQPTSDRNGGSGTITIDGAAPDFAGGVRINGASSAAWSTENFWAGTPRVPGVLPNSTAFNMNAYAAFVDYRITGLPAGSHTVRFTISSMGGGTPRVYSNGWARESPHEVPQIFNNIPITPYAATGPGAGDAALTVQFNTWTAEVLAEFPDVILGDLYGLMSPGGNPVEEMFINDAVHPSWYGSQQIANYLKGLIDLVPSDQLART